jgi:hypothetical protein
MKILPTLLRFVQMTSMKHKIDESHSLGHSMEVVHYTNHIYMDNVIKYPELHNQAAVIYTAAIIHDMCDKKYLDQKDGIHQINDLLKHKMNYHEIDKIDQIISTMSYSTVKKNGYPDLGNYQMAYHIVREADLLTAYDFDRSIIYHMYKTDGDFLKSYENAVDLFNNRVLKHHTDNLFITDYSKKKGMELHNNALLQMKSWKKIINTYDGTFIL